MKKFILLNFLLYSVISVATTESWIRGHTGPVTVNGILNDHPCKPLITQTAEKWGATRQWKRQGLMETDSYLFDTPTHEIGKWVHLKLAPKEILLSMITHHTVINKKINPQNCKVSGSLVRRNTDSDLVKNNFNDVKLGELLQKNKLGAFMVWSPYMPLSIRSIAQLKTAIKNSGLNIKVTSMIGGRTSQKAIDNYKKQYKEYKLAKEDFQKMQSFELLMRRTSNHYPALVFYKNGSMARWPIYGEKSVDAYEKRIKRFFK